MLAEPEVHLDFWGDWDNFPLARQPISFEQDWLVLFGSGHVFQRLSEYGIHEGMIDSNYYTNPGSTTYVNDGGLDDAGQSLLDDNSFPAIINNEIQGGTLPYPNDNTIYVIMLPPNIFTASMLKNNWGGYHMHASFGAQRYAFAIVSYSENDIMASHELYEAATDPDGNGLYDRNTGSEIGDLCQSYIELVAGLAVQKVWSQALCQCQ